MAQADGLDTDFSRISEHHRARDISQRNRTRNKRGSIPTGRRSGRRSRAGVRCGQASRKYFARSQASWLILPAPTHPRRGRSRIHTVPPPPHPEPPDVRTEPHRTFNPICGEGACAGKRSSVNEVRTYAAIILKKNALGSRPRDGTPTSNPAPEARRARMEEVAAVLRNIWDRTLPTPRSSRSSDAIVVAALGREVTGPA